MVDATDLEVSPDVVDVLRNHTSVVGTYSPRQLLQALAGCKPPLPSYLQQSTTPTKQHGSSGYTHGLDHASKASGP